MSFPSGFTSDDFTTTCTHTWIDDGSGNWRLKFLTSGTFTPKKNVKIDLFLVGGGNGGRNGVANNGGGGGGGGGYTGTWPSIPLTANQNYTITIGAGGAANGGTGGTTSISGPDITTRYITGGVPGANWYRGGNGGSGGGAGSGNVGGSDGSDGGGSSYYGSGQGTTTREFGEVSGPLYAGAGGAGGGAGAGGAGGAGGGGAGGNAPYSGTASPGVAGTTNLGGGGGAGGASTTKGAAGADGGSGILIIRNKR